jgi:hypothetical protein
MLKENVTGGKLGGKQREEGIDQRARKIKIN